MFLGDIEGRIAPDGGVEVRGGVYSVRDVTPYLHIFVNHSVELMKVHGYLGQYSCQALELMNKLQRSIYTQAMGLGGRAAVKRKREGKDPEPAVHKVLKVDYRKRMYQTEYAPMRKQLKPRIPCPFCTYDTLSQKCLATHCAKKHTGRSM